jgi:hypothetical protein
MRDVAADVVMEWRVGCPREVLAPRFVGMLAREFLGLGE